MLIEKSGLSFLVVDVRQLRCFIAVAEELHFGRAAQRLHVAQPAVSQTVKGLERELGMSLLDRSNRRVTLTEAGSVLLVEAYAVVNRVEGATTVMSRALGGPMKREPSDTTRPVSSRASRKRATALSRAASS